MTDANRNDLLMRLLDALERYYRHLPAVDDRDERAFGEIAAWFESTDASDEHGFERLCDEVGVDAEQIRRSLARRTREIRGARLAPRKR